MSHKILESALKYAATGFAVIPLQPGGKKPLSRHGSRDASMDEVQIREWWTKEPNANVGIVTGAISSLVGVDVDVKDGRPGHKSLDQLFDGIDRNTLTVITPTGGLHLYFKIPEHAIIINRADIMPGIDIRGEGGYLVAPPSIIGDQKYRWTEQSNLLVLPPQIHKRLNDRKKTNAKNTATEISEGSRNQRLASLAGNMRRQGAGRDSILVSLQTENQEKCKPPLTDGEVEQIVNSIMRYDPQVDDHLTYSDLGNSERFIKEHGSDVRFVAEYNKWIVWDGKRWEIDAGNGLNERTTLTTRSIYYDALQEQEQEKRKFMIGWAKTSASAAKAEAMLKIAKFNNKVMIKQEILDNDPWLFGVSNGIIDLKTGHLCEPRRGDMVTCAGKVEYRPQAQCPLFTKFLDQIFDDNAPVIEFLQRAIGYSLTGHATEQCLFFAYGRGANGKSTLFHVINTLMGDYSRSISAEMLMDRPQGAQTNDLARLRGSRFITTVEIEEGKRMAEALVKQVTGGEKISARFLYGEFFEYLPTFKLWLAANHHPVIRGTDAGIWRRIRLIPFTVSIREKDRDKDLSQKLLEELPGILNWAIDGCLSWQRQGLNPPPEVLAVTAQYKGEMDILGSWITECCVEDGEARGKAMELYNSYKKWAMENGEYVMPQSKFKTKMVERGFERLPRSRVGVAYKGIGLMAPEYSHSGEEI